jgi:hypothetical protein
MIRFVKKKKRKKKKDFYIETRWGRIDTSSLILLCCHVILPRFPDSIVKVVTTVSSRPVVCFSYYFIFYLFPVILSVCFFVFI